MANRILVVDDDKEIVDAIEIYLKNEGLEIIKAYDGMQALEIVADKPIDLIIMDVMMPKMDGLRATMKIRESKDIPILVLSARSEDTDKIIGLNLGADDYITKPFNPLELIARVRSHLRRYIAMGDRSMNTAPENELRTGDLVLDLDTKEAHVGGEAVKLTPTEYGILEFLMRNQGKVFSIEQIYETVWNEPSYNSDNTVAVHIRRIREKIEIDPKEPRYLKVVWGIGYKIERY
ncbi:MAG: response regulator transcription factor [Peptostreptococcaceae bacterium]|nr:response regulator transcription factor [Peptostreptococcaceae bacterium]